LSHEGRLYRVRAVADSPYKIRRATLDDLPALRALWAKVNLPAPDLEKRFTEVQIAENGAGEAVGALGLKIDKQHGHIHSEAIPDDADPALYAAFWERLQIISRNFGLFRTWIGSTRPFWPSIGFVAPDQKALEKAPAGLGLPKENLLTLTLKEESSDGLSVEQQFEIFTQAQKAETERLLHQAQVFKRVAYTIILLISGGLLIYAVMRFLTRGQRRGDRR